MSVIVLVVEQLQFRCNCASHCCHSTVSTNARFPQLPQRLGIRQFRDVDCFAFDAYALAQRFRFDAARVGIRQFRDVACFSFDAVCFSSGFDAGCFGFDAASASTQDAVGSMGSMTRRLRPTSQPIQAHAHTRWDPTTSRGTSKSEKLPNAFSWRQQFTNRALWRGRGPAGSRGRGSCHAHCLSGWCLQTT